MTILRPATNDDFAQWYGRRVQFFAGVRDGKLVGMGGLIEKPDGRRFVVLDVLDNHGGLGVVRQLRRLVRSWPRPLYAACWDWQYREAPRLFKIIGFEPTGEVTKDHKEVWVLK